MKHMLRRLFARPELSAEQHAILAALADGQTLKSHRTIEGDKTYTLHALDGTTHSVSMDAVLDLRARRLIETNHKFPAATFLLTTTGTAQVHNLTTTGDTTALRARHFVSSADK
ncbi:MAG: hypothetical protein M9918_24790 [Anaerolineae bacterium]|nr:hypothetical protein [Anaerolineae bacterium]